MTKPRLPTLDILRGYFMFIVIVDHVELYPSGFDFLTGRGRMWVSAAEGFFFISGLLVGLIYRQKLHQGLAVISARIWKRALQLYLLAVLITLVSTYLAFNYGQDVKFGLSPSVQLKEVLGESFSLQYSYGWADFLSHYAWFMAAAPLVILLLARQAWWLVLAAIVALWVNRGDSFELGWQLIFYGGLMVGYFRSELQQRWQSYAQPIRRLTLGMIYSLAGITFIFSYASTYLLAVLNSRLDSLPANLAVMTERWDRLNEQLWPYFEKWSLEPGRIIVFLLWMIVLYQLVQRYHQPINRVSRRMFEKFGQNSLFVYVLHALTVLLLHLSLTTPTSLIANFALTTAVLLMINEATNFKLALTRYLRLRSKQRASSPTVTYPVIGTEPV